jgi:hypothetical protein
MNDTESWAMREVDGGELYLRRPPGGCWEVNYYERVLNARTAIVEGALRSERLNGHHFEGQTFASPEEAAETVRRRLGTRNR